MDNILSTSVVSTSSTDQVRYLNLIERLQFLSKLQGDMIEAVGRLLESEKSVGVRLVGLNAVFTRDHRLIEQVFVSRQQNYCKSREYELLIRLLGKGLLTTNDIPAWTRNRRMMQPMFSHRALPVFEHTMVAVIDRLLGRWATRPKETPIDISAEMMHVTLGVVGSALFGMSFQVEDLDRVGHHVDVGVKVAINAAKVLSTGLARIVPGLSVDNAMRIRPFGHRQLVQAADELEKTILALIAERRKAAAAGRSVGNDLLSQLIGLRDEETGASLSDRQICDEVATFLLAGHETTATALAWMWTVLSKNPQVRADLYDEVDTVLAGRTPTVEDIPSLPICGAVFQETLRLYSPVHTLVREAIEIDEFKGSTITPGTIVVPSLYFAHRDPDVWDNPEGFDYMRFMPGAPKPPRGAYLPFGGGKRICIGAGFAQMEAVLITAMIAQRYTLDLVPGHNPEALPQVTYRPKCGIPMVLHERTAQGADAA
ncbi:cytochrome P450 [Mycobacteroides chelonae]|nr:cytochrome P450 [Mycobacteroides chelonae]